MVWSPPRPLLLPPPEARLCALFQVISEQVRDNVVTVDSINQPLAVVVDKPAGHLGAVSDILAVVFLGAPAERREIP